MSGGIKCVRGRQDAAALRGNAGSRREGQTGRCGCAKVCAHVEDATMRVPSGLGGLAGAGGVGSGHGISPCVLAHAFATGGAGQVAGSLGGPAVDPPALRGCTATVPITAIMNVYARLDDARPE